MKRTGPKESTKVIDALAYLKRYPPVPIVKIAYMFSINPSTLYRALQRRKERKC